MNKEQRDALFGASASFSEHKENDVIQFRQGTDIKQGTILHVRAPGPAIIGGCEHPLLYIVDTGKGFPDKVYPSQIIHGSFPVILASYGYAENGCMLSRKAAEHLAVNIEGQVIDTDKGRLRVLKARLEGDARQGQVIAECEVAEQEKYPN